MINKYGIVIKRKGIFPNSFLLRKNEEKTVEVPIVNRSIDSYIKQLNY